MLSIVCHCYLVFLLFIANQSTHLLDLLVLEIMYDLSQQIHTWLSRTRTFVHTIPSSHYPLLYYTDVNHIHWQTE